MKAKRKSQAYHEESYEDYLGPVAYNGHVGAQFLIKPDVSV